MYRYVILIASVLMQVCLGATYSWAMFVSELKKSTSLGQGMVHFPFTVFYIAFPATTIFAGLLLERLGPRRCAMIGGVVFGSGWLVAGLGYAHFALTIVGIGVLGGIGVGLAYLVPITVCVQWFPRQKGLVTGIAVSGFGGGAALVAAVAGHMLQRHGLSPFACFGYLGMIFAVVVPVAGMFLRRPDETPSPAAAHNVPPVSFREPAFRTLYLAMLAGLMAGFAVNANLKELVPGLSVNYGAVAVGCFALANAIGRIVWGAVFDRVDSKTAILANALSQAALLFGAGWILRSETGLYIFASVAGFNYGGVLVVYASTTARQWGVERMGRVYGRLFSANILASVAPVLAGAGFDTFGSFNIALAAIALLSVLACGLVRLDKTIVPRG